MTPADPPRAFETDDLPAIVTVGGRVYRIVERTKILTWDRKGVAYEYVVERAGNAD